MKEQHRRRNSVRYPGYDYAQAVVVFVTVCTSGRQTLFGVVIDQAVSLSPAGELVHDTWQRVPERFPGVLLDAWIVMPDHLHGILVMGADPDMPFSPDTTGDIIRWFKSTTVAGYRKDVVEGGWTPYDRHLWQRGYYDHVVRNDTDLDRVRRYIAANPARWSMKNPS
jgi:REP element-mobilizing transposase RayT